MMKFLTRLKFFPISFYSVVMGLLGLSIAIQKTTEIFSLNKTIPLIFITTSLTIFCIISLIFLCKIIFYKDEVVKDFLHPIKISFFPTFSISLLLLAIAFLPIFSTLSYIFWILGTFTHASFTFIIISTWVRRNNFKIEHLNPAWFIPVVGNLLIPVAGSAFVSKELLWFFFSTGIIFWIMLLTIVIHRIFFFEPLTEKMLPTLFILMAPPAIGTISYFKLTLQIDNFSRILYNFSLFMAIFLALNVGMLISKKFYLSKWAFTFPMAAVSIASALMFHETKIHAFLFIHLTFMILTGIIIAVLTCKTLKAIYLHDICLDE